VRIASLAALLTGTVAAALDFASAASLAGGGGDALAFSVCLGVLGVAALSAGVAAALPRMRNSSGRIGLAMEVLGVAMVAMGAWGPMTGALTDFAMLAVGGLMVLSGAAVQRKIPMAPSV
jgi:hypothetical protein